MTRDGPYHQATRPPWNLRAGEEACVVPERSSLGPDGTSNLPSVTVGNSAVDGRSSTIRPLRQLSAREQQVVSLIANGLTNREIARKLYITEGTAANHVWHVLNKLGLNSRTQVAVWAVHHGLLAQ